MRGPWAGAPEEEIVALVAAHWDVGLTELRYLPVGAGAFHWTAVDGTGARWFVTVDDLDTKPWLGHERDGTFESLARCYALAAAVRDAGADFVAAPLATIDGASAVRLGDQHSVALVHHLDGAPGEWGQPLAAPAADELVDRLALLHAFDVEHEVEPRPLEVPDRPRLEAALDDVERPWTGGPLAEEARVALAAHVEGVRQALQELDEVAARLADAGRTLVVTHGEPHPGNLVQTKGGLRLVDWDTVAPAPPERDLWMAVEASPTAVDRHRSRTGVVLDPELLAAYRQLWALSDLASYAGRLRERHNRSPDVLRALAAIQSILSGDEPAPYGPRRR